MFLRIASLEAPARAAAQCGGEDAKAGCVSISRVAGEKRKKEGGEMTFGIIPIF
jgi:hypothetical protein